MDTTGDDPNILEGKDITKASFCVTFSLLSDPKNKDTIMQPVRELSANLAIVIDGIIRENKIMDWQKRDDVQKKMMREISDFLMDKEGLHLEFDDIDLILERIMDIARRRYAS